MMKLFLKDQTPNRQQTADRTCIFQWQMLCRCFAILPGLLLLLGCATPSARETMESRQNEAHPSRDTLWTDTFYLSQPESPERPAGRWQFFYKDCERARRNPYNNRTEWDCNGPK